jgi:hypothetical protein
MKEEFLKARIIDVQEHIIIVLLKTCLFVLVTTIIIYVVWLKVKTKI